MAAVGLIESLLIPASLDGSTVAAPKQFVVVAKLKDVNGKYESYRIFDFGVLPFFGV